MVFTEWCRSCCPFSCPRDIYLYSLSCVRARLSNITSIRSFDTFISICLYHHTSRHTRIALRVSQCVSWHSSSWHTIIPATSFTGPYVSHNSFTSLIVHIPNSSSTKESQAMSAIYSNTHLSQRVCTCVVARLTRI